MLRPWRNALVSILALAALDLAAAAQCPLPDLLDGPCCAVTNPQFPAFPNFTKDALVICWRDCNVDQLSSCKSRWTLTPLLPTKGKPCAERLMTVDLFDASGPKWTGNMRLTYSRTWAEIDASGNFLQVWRFLVNGDMTPLAPLPIPCPVPPCAPVNGNRVRFTGYLDYARDCNGVFQHVWMLTHACDSIDHRAGFPRAGAFHPDRSYTFLAPMAGFVAGPVQPIEGTPGSPFEAVRRRLFPPPATVGPVRCEFEERITHALTPIQQQCLCGAPTAPPQFMNASLSIAGACGTSVTTPGGPFFPPGFLSMGIGAWTIPGVYPGTETLRWNAGGYDYTEGCTGVIRREVFFGVTTLQGNQAFQILTPGIGAPLPLTFVDQANSLRPPSALATVMNVPYLSDHIINLNH